MKNILLKLANWIYRHYNQSVEIKFNDIIKFNNNYYVIYETILSQQIGHANTLKLELKDISSMLN